MSPDDRARYYLAYEAAYPFGLFGCTASELDGVAEEMREVAEAADLAAAAAVLDDYEYGGDNRAAARAIRAFLDIVDPPDPADLEERLAAAERERDEARAERDRLQAILDAERGVRGPEGWEWRGSWWRGASATPGSIRVCWRFPGNWELWKIGDSMLTFYPTALDAMEAADAAAKEEE